MVIEKLHLSVSKSWLTPEYLFFPAWAGFSTNSVRNFLNEPWGRDKFRWFWNNLEKLHLSVSKSWLTPDYLFFPAWAGFSANSVRNFLNEPWGREQIALGLEQYRKAASLGAKKSFSINGRRLSINQASLIFRIRLAPLASQARDFKRQIFMRKQLFPLYLQSHP